MRTLQASIRASTLFTLRYYGMIWGITISAFLLILSAVANLVVDYSWLAIVMDIVIGFSAGVAALFWLETKSIKAEENPTVMRTFEHISVAKYPEDVLKRAQRLRYQIASIRNLRMCRIDRMMTTVIRSPSWPVVGRLAVFDVLRQFYPVIPEELFLCYFGHLCRVVVDSLIQGTICGSVSFESLMILPRRAEMVCAPDVTSTTHTNGRSNGNEFARTASSILRLLEYYASPEGKLSCSSTAESMRDSVRDAWKADPVTGLTVQAIIGQYSSASRVRPLSRSPMTDSY